MNNNNPCLHQVLHLSTVYMDEEEKEGYEYSNQKKEYTILDLLKGALYRTYKSMFRNENNRKLDKSDIES